MVILMIGLDELVGIRPGIFAMTDEALTSERAKKKKKLSPGDRANQRGDDVMLSPSGTLDLAGLGVTAVYI